MGRKVGWLVDGGKRRKGSLNLSCEAQNGRDSGDRRDVYMLIWQASQLGLQGNIV